MSKLLHVVTSPQAVQHSFSRKVSNAFVSSYAETHREDTIDTLDVWSEPLPEFGAVAASWKIKTMGGLPPNESEIASVEEVNAAIERFLSADKYVFSIPMWNFAIPYRLKQYLDVIVQPGKTFKFDPAEGYSGLVPAGRPVQLIISSAGSYAEGSPLASFDHLRPYMNMILSFIGLTDIRTLTADCTAYGPQVSDPILAKAVTDAMQAAKAF
jgi:FMN-dependent NADH-azoreductase